MNIDIDRQTEAILRASQAIMQASAAQPISFALADEIARVHGIELGIVLGHLTLINACAIDYLASKIQCIEQT